jgi:Trk K+ transport system NAD-binding subunit
MVGAGPTGLTLADQIHVLGAGVRIVDRQVDRVHESRALGVQRFAFARSAPEKMPTAAGKPHRTAFRACSGPGTLASV